MALLELTNVSVRFSLSKKRPDLVALEKTLWRDLETQLRQEEAL